MHLLSILDSSKHFCSIHHSGLDFDSSCFFHQCMGLCFVSHSITDTVPQKWLWCALRSFCMLMLLTRLDPLVSYYGSFNRQQRVEWNSLQGDWATDAFSAITVELWAAYCVWMVSYMMSPFSLFCICCIHRVLCLLRPLPGLYALEVIQILPTDELELRYGQADTNHASISSGSNMVELDPLHVRWLFILEARPLIHTSAYPSSS